MNAATQYASPIYPIIPKETAYVTSLSDRGAGFAIPTFDVLPSDVEGFMEELWEFQATLHDCFARSEPRAHFFDSKQVSHCLWR